MNQPPEPSIGNAVDPDNVAAASRRCPPLPNYFDPKSPVAYLKGDLPHWRQDGATYFVTFRLANSLPQEKLDQWLREREDWLVEHPEPHDEAAIAEYYELFPKRFQAWLDNGHGSCVLELPEIKQLVEAALRHFDSQRYRLDEHVVMPNHVHALVTPTGENTLSEILHSWKSFTAHKILKLEAAMRWLKKFALKKRGASPVLHVWQKESFDHIIRSPEQLGRIREYIREKPSARGKAVDG
jgi:REP element-mobilizing transposase RayT